MTTATARNQAPRTRRLVRYRPRDLAPERIIGAHASHMPAVSAGIPNRRSASSTGQKPLAATHPALQICLAQWLPSGG